MSTYQQRLNTELNTANKTSNTTLKPRKDMSIDIMDKFFDFGFNTRKRKLSEKLSSNLKPKIAYPGKQDITKRILNALQKDSSAIKTDHDNSEVGSPYVKIKE